MGFFEKRRLRSRIRSAGRLRDRLRKLYGPKRSYTHGQVRRAASESRLAAASAPWAYAIHCDAEEFSAAGVEGDYRALREQVEDAFPDRAEGFAADEGLRDRYATAVGGAGDWAFPWVAGTYGWFGRGEAGGGDMGGADSGGGGGDA